MLEVHCQPEAVSWDVPVIKRFKNSQALCLFLILRILCILCILCSFNYEDHIAISLDTPSISEWKKRRTKCSTTWASMPFAKNKKFASGDYARVITFAFRAIATSGDIASAARCCWTMVIFSHDRSDDGIKLISRCWQAGSFNSISSFAIYLNSLENIPTLFNIIICLDLIRPNSLPLTRSEFKFIFWPLNGNLNLVRTSLELL